ncbi:helix-turn-helix domain-containing protein [Streptomyces sp. NRRL S-350]|uniref:helix-turn-helix domain-containing protein n=1 Tax=Streptomyces sp. NRRL S-350 TaxID=1463902 RepID=UPI00131EC875|nr:helix-turn-helix domain-containing protein [Streptomyces sp. NRRL S-350]
MSASRPMWWEVPEGATWHRGVDLVAVRRALSMRGPCPELSEEEQRYAVVEAARTGVPGPAIAERIGVADRTVTRWWLQAEEQQAGVTSCG